MTRSASRACERGYRSCSRRELRGLLCAQISKRGLEVFPLILSTQVKRRLKTTTFLLVAFVLYSLSKLKCTHTTDLKEEIPSYTPYSFSRPYSTILLLFLFKVRA